MLDAGVVLALTVMGHAATDSRPAHASEEAEARAGTVRAEVALELESLGSHPWAGRYYWGDGLGANVSLHLAPRAGFVFEWHGCLGLYGRNYGRVVEAPPLLRLEPDLPNRDGGFGGIEEKLIPVAWATRRYLIGAPRLHEFCNAVNAREEPRSTRQGQFLLHDGDEARSVAGRPRSADGDLSCLLDRPLLAQVVSVGPKRTWTGVGGIEWEGVPVVIDRGASDGVWIGMRFHVVRPEGVSASAEVTSVANGSSEARFETLAGEDLHPRPGWRLSTLPAY